MIPTLQRKKLRQKVSVICPSFTVSDKAKYVVNQPSSGVCVINYTTEDGPSRQAASEIELCSGRDYTVLCKHSNPAIFPTPFKAMWTLWNFCLNGGCSLQLKKSDFWLLHRNLFDRSIHCCKEIVAVEVWNLGQGRHWKSLPRAIWRALEAGACPLKKWTFLSRHVPAWSC